MKVTLIHATADADVLLIFTKQTRLNMTTGLMNEIANWPKDKREAELAYMSTSIKSSWEFIHLTFLVEGLSRAAAQQVTRTRTASYAMQSQRVTDVRDMGVVLPKLRDEHQAKVWDSAIAAAKDAYGLLIDDDMPKEDARGVLPMASECNIVIQYNLRSFTDMLKARKSLRAQGEYAEMALKMEALTIGAWPWAEPFFVSSNDAAITILQRVAKDLGVQTGTGPAWEIGKAIDLIR